MDRAVKTYMASVPPARKPRVESLHRVITDAFPDAVLDMQYKMPTYRVGDGWVALANQKNYVSLYTCGYHHIARFKAKHPKIKTGRGCINFRDTDPLPLGDIEAVVKHAINHPKSGSA